jgi:transcriptional regulator with XRE-family HTH domain
MNDDPARGIRTFGELADRAGLSARYLGSIERASVSGSVTVLGRLAQALRIDPCDLIRAPQRR